MFESFRSFTEPIDGVDIHGVVGGAGPPILLLHGYPQTHAMWHAVAPILAERHTVVAADLRGYGASSKPDPTPDHATYSKRAMAADMVGLMRALGFERFGILGHDRGARVAHRLALDRPDAASALVLLDIAPTREMYARTTDAFARAYWHWFFLIQEAPFPERMIAADPRAFWKKKCGAAWGGLEVFTEEALEAYLTAFEDPRCIAATCEDYRAAATIDLAHDDADDGRKVACPLRALWGERGVIEALFDCLALWRERAERVEGRALPGGHYLAEELPELVAADALEFFARVGEGGREAAPRRGSSSPEGGPG